MTQLFSIYGVASACLACGPHAAVGPTFGIASTGRPTLGWEVSAASLAIGQSFAHGTARVNTGSSSEGRERFWRRRTYAAWEPRFGGVFERRGVSLDWPGRKGDSGFGFAGLGATLGLLLENPPRPARLKFMGGAWIGGGYALPAASQPDCSGAGRLYFSIAFGIRAGEGYFAPKVGVLSTPCSLF